MPRKKNVFKKFVRKAGRFIKKGVNRVFGTNFLQMRSKMRRAGAMKLVASKGIQQDDFVPIKYSTVGRYQQPLSQNFVQRLQRASAPHTMVNLIKGQNEKSTTGVKWWSMELAGVDDITHCFNKLAITESIAGALENTRAIVNRCTQEITLVNQSSGRVNIKVYEYLAKNNLPHVYGNTYQVVGGNMGSSPSGWTQNSTHEQDYESVNGNLYNNPVFTTYYNIKKTFDISIAPGKTYKLKQACNYSRTLNRLIWDSDLAVTEGGFTRGYVFRAVGSPMTGTGDYVGTVGLHPIFINTLQERVYDVSAMYNNRGHIYSNISNVNRLPGNNESIQEQSGDVEAPVVAGIL